MNSSCEFFFRIKLNFAEYDSVCKVPQTFGKNGVCVLF